VKVLVIAAEPITAEDLSEALGEDAREAEVKVVTPALNDSRLAFWVSDSDAAIAEAESVRDETVEQLDRAGVQATGDTGESEPLVALQDALATFAAERVVVFRHPRDEQAYAEDDLRAEAERRFGIPVTEVPVARR